MMSLFSSFDLYFMYAPLLTFFLILFFFLSKFYKISMYSYIFSGMKNLLMFFISLKPKMYNKFSLLLLMSSMIVVMSVNLISVFSFNFPFTSQFGSILMLSISLWASFLIFYILNNIFGFLSHLIPEGAPIYLSFILFLIELVSNFIRPLTLSVRLVANILAGHLLMILLSKLVFMKLFIFPLYIILNMVELFVALIQSYIFCTMICLYFSEVN